MGRLLNHLIALGFCLGTLAYGAEKSPPPSPLPNSPCLPTFKEISADPHFRALREFSREMKLTGESRALVKWARTWGGSDVIPQLENPNPRHSSYPAAVSAWSASPMAKALSGVATIRNLTEAGLPLVSLLPGKQIADLTESQRRWILALKIDFMGQSPENNAGHFFPNLISLRVPRTSLVPKSLAASPSNRWPIVIAPVLRDVAFLNIDIRSIPVANYGSNPWEGYRLGGEIAQLLNSLEVSSGVTFRFDQANLFSDMKQKLILPKRARVDIDEPDFSKSQIEGILDWIEFTDRTELALTRSFESPYFYSILLGHRLEKLTALEFREPRVRNPLDQVRLDLLGQRREGVSKLTSLKLPSLVSLNWGETTLSARDAVAVAKWDLPKLTRLDLSQTNLTVESAKALGKWKLPRLSWVDVNPKWPDEVVMEVWLQWPEVETIFLAAEARGLFK